VQYEKAGAYTPYEAAIRAALREYDPNKLPDSIKDDTKAIDKHKNAIDYNINTTQSASEALNIMTTATGENAKAMFDSAVAAGTAAISCANSVAQAQQIISSANGGSGGGGGCSGGGGGCRTFKCGSYTTDGHNESYSSGGGPSSSPGMAWYNVLGNENAAYTASKGESFANSVTKVTRNSCSGLVCSFEAGGSKYYGDGGGGYFSVNDALITSKGDVIQFHPDDNILAFKDGAKLQGKGVVINNTFNINGNGDPDRIAEEIMKKIQRIGRMGF
jgi:hypothetical protein